MNLVYLQQEDPILNLVVILILEVSKQEIVIGTVLVH